MRILIIRRDNIGDLVCTTPLLNALRRDYPNAYIGILVSSYNAEVLNGNSDVDEILIYQKRQQTAGRKSRLSLWLERIKLVLEIRRLRFDVIFLANGGWRYARRLGAKKIIGFKEFFLSDKCQPDVIVPLETPTSLHEVEKMGCLAGALGVNDATGKLQVFPDEEVRSVMCSRLLELGWSPKSPTIAIHISQRSHLQRWPKDKFLGLVSRLSESHPEFQFLLLWSPGSSDRAIYPGDDVAASDIISKYQGKSLYPTPTSSVSELVAACSLSDYFVGSDGGAMHIAAGLGKPIVCFFGGVSNVSEWHPWGVPYNVLTHETKLVENISVEDAVQAFNQLFSESGGSGLMRVAGRNSEEGVRTS